MPKTRQQFVFCYFMGAESFQDTLLQFLTSSVFILELFLRNLLTFVACCWCKHSFVCQFVIPVVPLCSFHVRTSNGPCFLVLLFLYASFVKGIFSGTVCDFQGVYTRGQVLVPASVIIEYSVLQGSLLGPRLNRNRLISTVFPLIRKLL